MVLWCTFVVPLPFLLYLHMEIGQTTELIARFVEIKIHIELREQVLINKISLIFKSKMQNMHARRLCDCKNGVQSCKAWLMYFMSPKLRLHTRKQAAYHVYQRFPQTAVGSGDCK